MAAIDKIYVNTTNKYLQFKEWCKKQPPLLDKYGKKAFLTSYLYEYNEEQLKVDKCRPIFNAPYYVDAYVIRNCPFDFIQKELMLNYGHWSQEKINKAYDIVINRNDDNKMYYTWLSEKDFEIVNGVITMPKLEKSDYDLIKEGKLYNSPLTSIDYKVGHHFKCVKHPYYRFNKPFKAKNYWVSVNLPDEMGYMWYHDTTNTWDFYDEFVVSKWSSSHANCGSIRALKRHLLKWKLPIGARIIVHGRYAFDDYEFIIKK
jgi:hypothetical protein